MEEDGFHQGDHVPAGIVPSTHNCDVKELQKTNGAFLRLDIHSLQGPSAPPWDHTTGRGFKTQPFPCRRSLKERWEFPNSEAESRSLAATAPVFSGEGRYPHPLSTMESQEEAPAWPEHRESSAR